MNEATQREYILMLLNDEPMFEYVKIYYNTKTRCFEYTDDDGFLDYAIKYEDGRYCIPYFLTHHTLFEVLKYYALYKE